MSKLISKPCKMCGRIMENVDSRRKYCKDCYKRIRVIYQTEYREREKYGTVRKKPHKPALSLADAVKAATSAGMTYGQWVLHERSMHDQERH